MADCPDGEDEGDYYDGMDDESDDEMGTMSHDGTNHTDDANGSDDWDDANGSDDDDMDEDMVCYNLVSHATTNDSAESCEAYGWFENASFDGMNFTGCYNTVSHEVTWDGQDACES